MKKIFLKLAIISVAIFVLYGCPDPRVDTLYQVSGLIGTYCSTNNLDFVRESNSDVIRIVIRKDNKFYMDRVENGNVIWGEIRRRNRDTFNYDYSANPDESYLSYNRVAMGNKLKNITITSEDDWSGDYPAGSNLNSCFYFFSSSPDKYLSNKSIVVDYLNLEDYYKNNLEGIDGGLKRYLDPGSVFLPILGKVNEVNYPEYNIALLEDKKNLYGPIENIFCMLIPVEKPVNPITIKVRFSFDVGDDTILEIPL